MSEKQEEKKLTPSFGSTILRISTDDIQQFIERIIPNVSLEKDPLGQMLNETLQRIMDKASSLGYSAVLSSPSFLEQITPLNNARDIMNLIMIKATNTLIETSNRKFDEMKFEFEKMIEEKNNPNKEKDIDDIISQINEINDIEFFAYIIAILLTIRIATFNLPPELRSSPINEREGFTIIGGGEITKKRRIF